MPRLESLIERGLGVAWASALPTAAVQVFAVRGRHDLVELFERVLERARGEAYERLVWRASTTERARGEDDAPPHDRLPQHRSVRAIGWLPDEPLDLEAEAAWDVSREHHTEVLGFIAARLGPAEVDRLVAWLGERGVAPGPALISAVLADPSLRARHGDHLPRTDDPPEALLEELTITMSRASDWLPYIGAALLAPDRDRALDDLIAPLLASGRIQARAYVDGILAPAPLSARLVEKQLARLVAELPPVPHAPLDRELALRRVARTFERVAGEGAHAALTAALPAVIERLGPPATWGAPGYRALCALHLLDEARRACPSPTPAERVALVEAHARMGNLDHLDYDLTPVLQHGFVTTHFYPHPWGTQGQLDPYDLVRIGRVTSAPDRPARLAAALARLPC